MMRAGAGGAVGRISGITCDATLAELLRGRRGRVVIDFVPGRGRHVWFPPEGGDPPPGTPCTCGRERWGGAAAPWSEPDAPPGVIHL